MRSVKRVRAMMKDAFKALYSHASSSGGGVDRLEQTRGGWLEGLGAGPPGD